MLRRLLLCNAALNLFFLVSPCSRSHSTSSTSYSPRTLQHFSLLEFRQQRRFGHGFSALDRRSLSRARVCADDGHAAGAMRRGGRSGEARGSRDEGVVQVSSLTSSASRLSALGCALSCLGSCTKPWYCSTRARTWPHLELVFESVSVPSTGRARLANCNSFVSCSSSRSCANCTYCSAS